ncbi:unnamed protein product (macronuclear) [Paramecium tetraurelia]|uniref:C2 NT-type domain-containing protein n=1 Tax=Paramecium tetraurelia TaxID=5888 RepID=A0CVM6_PARTE|nr:uncharacterized protein GSPATT00011011001 [Paramecium tetraurelia]CAK74843.1 unnamed protein product [Paramecium tetraurelia]|eukprot:XP_001442240.1 hypothetical protein (macronuclear) [Paramecium tetraurelia strain d4-2]
MSNNIFDTDFSLSRKFKIRVKGNGQVSHTINSSKKNLKQSTSFSVPILQEIIEGEKKPQTKLNYSFQGKEESTTSTFYYNFSKTLDFELNFSNYGDKLRFYIHKSFKIQDNEFSLCKPKYQIIHSLKNRQSESPFSIKTFKEN